MSRYIFALSFALSTTPVLPVPPTTVPEPASLAVLGLGVAGLVAMRRRARG